MDYHPLIKYRVTARNRETFEGYIYTPNKSDELWIYETTVWNGDSYADEAVRIIYDRGMKHDFPFSSNEVRGKNHIATVKEADVVIPLTAPLPVEELLEELHARRGRR